MHSRLTISIFLSTVLLSAASPDVTVNWPQWRGPNSSGVAPDKNLPTEWSNSKNVAWKTAIPGKGYSSPIVWGNRIFLTTAIQGDLIPGRAKGKTHKLDGEDFVHPDAANWDHIQNIKLLSLDAQSGKILWERTIIDGPMFDSSHSSGSYASLTPVTDGKYVYSYFGTDGLFAHDFDGRQIWKFEPGPCGTVGVGYGASPAISGNMILLQCDDDNGEYSAVIGVDKRTGKEAWRTKRPVTAGWSSPIVVGNQLLASGNEFVISYDTATGKELWRAKGLESNAVPTPVWKDDMVYFSSGQPVKITLAIRMGGSGDITDTPNMVWKHARGTGYTPSNIVYGDFLYLISDKGILSCLDAMTGAVKYDNGRVPVPSRFSASPVAYDGKLFITSEDGDTHVIAAGPEHKVLRTNSLDEPVMASPAIAGGGVYIRGVRNLYKISQMKQ